MYKNRVELCFLPILIFVCLFVENSCAQNEIVQKEIIVAVGAGGDSEYSTMFDEWASRWRKAADRAKATFHLIGNGANGEENDSTVLKRTIEEAGSRNPQQIWIVLIGHGTFDGKLAKFNLSGPDISADELASWTNSIKSPITIINCTSASGPFINKLSGSNRVVITATNSGFEYNFARFGDYFSAAILDNTIDLDKDQQTTLLEAFLKASADVQEFYDQDSRLSTEHALLDDNGDRLGTPADWFQGIRTTRVGKNGELPDGSRANQFYLTASSDRPALSPELKKQRDQLEFELEKLRQQKTILDEDLYFRQLESIMLKLAKTYADADQ